MHVPWEHKPMHAIVYPPPLWAPATRGSSWPRRSLGAREQAAIGSRLSRAQGHASVGPDQNMPYQRENAEDRT